MTSFLKSLASSTIGRQALQEEAAAVLAHRGELVAELERLRTEHMAKVTPLIKSESDAKARLSKAEESVQVARKGLGEAQIALTQVCNSFERKRQEIERELTSTASPLIGAFVGRLRMLFDELGHESINVPSGRGRGLLNPKETAALQQAVSVKNARIAHIQTVIGEAEGLKLVALSDGELSKKLGTFRKAVS